MALSVCSRCTAKYAVGLESCPQCGAPHEAAFVGERGPEIEMFDGEQFTDLTKLTKLELIEYADRHGIDLGDAGNKPEIIDVISSAPLPPAGGDDLGEQEPQ